MNKRILLADDSLTIQKVVELTFLDESFDVDAVGSGDEAIAELQATLPDIVIADVHMPGPSGYDVCRRAKDLDPSLPVLLLVGTFESFDESEFEACGADEHLKKPFDSQELLQMVMRMSSAPRQAAGGAAQAAGFDLGLMEEPEMEPDELESGDSIDLRMSGDGFVAPKLQEPGFEDVPLEEATGWATTREDDTWADETREARIQEDPIRETAAFGVGAGSEDIEDVDEAVASLLESRPDEDPDEDLEPAEGPPAAWELESPSPPAPAAPLSAPSGLSDGDVERVARRVVELLSDDAVREVAWDVIPDMAEIVIRERIRELEAEAE